MAYVFFLKMEMIRVTSSFADGPVNFNPTGPVEDQVQKLISSTAMREIICDWGEKCKHVDFEKHRGSNCSFEKWNCPLNCGSVIERLYISFFVNVESLL